ncbi:MAG TPA: TIGR01212 family radical SAM protein [Salinivirgaceae bacterium]|nr:TIGR01212 family radical SAM protein [Salinivirgaceae bacterium]HQA76034.1 TIGR01212 family radical SAM protein [Salinivirgaceae bacterium]
MYYNGERFYKYSRYLEKKFGTKVQKVSIDAGLSCPNRDGTMGTEGCIYCNNQSFTPKYCTPSTSIAEQINEGIKFFERKRHYSYLAYFQSYTNTYTDPETLYQMLLGVVENQNVVGIIISTRPDCVSDDILEVLLKTNRLKPVAVEFGVESTLNRSLELLNRGHNYQQVCDSVNRLHEAGIETGVHLILGIPGETREDMVSHATEISKLPISTVKLHQLQIIKNTKLAEMYRSGSLSFKLLDWCEYVELCADFVEHLRPNIAIERFASQAIPELIEVPMWKDVRNHHITHFVQNKLIERDTFQGKFYQKGP